MWQPTTVPQRALCRPVRRPATKFLPETLPGLRLSIPFGCPIPEFALRLGKQSFCSPVRTAQHLAPKSDPMPARMTWIERRRCERAAGRRDAASSPSSARCRCCASFFSAASTCPRNRFCSQTARVARTACHVLTIAASMTTQAIATATLLRQTNFCRQ